MKYENQICTFLNWTVTAATVVAFLGLAYTLYDFRRGAMIYLAALLYLLAVWGGITLLFPDDKPQQYLPPQIAGRTRFSWKQDEHR